MATAKKSVKEERTVNFSCRLLPREIAELAKSARANSRTIAGEIRFRLFPPQAAK